MGRNYRTRSPDRKTQKERIKEITEQLEAGVAAVFESDAYKAYLKCMSKFHNYSLNNTLLIALQRPDASLCASYTSWQKDHGRQVRKGEKGIKIIAPCKYKVELEEKDEDGNQKIAERTGFKVVTTFDISQTDGPELPTVGVNELAGDVGGYRKLFNALTEMCPVPIYTEDIKNGAKGYYSAAEAEHGPMTLVRFDGDNGEYSILLGHAKGIDGPYTKGTYVWGRGREPEAPGGEDRRGPVYPPLRGHPRRRRAGDL